MCSEEVMSQVQRTWKQAFCNQLVEQWIQNLLKEIKIVATVNTQMIGTKYH